MYRICEHCNKEVNIKVYKEHKRLYFNITTNSWTKEHQDISSLELSAFDSEFEIAAGEYTGDFPVTEKEESEDLKWGNNQDVERCEDLPRQGLHTCS